MMKLFNGRAQTNWKRRRLNNDRWHMRSMKLSCWPSSKIKWRFIEETRWYRHLCGHVWGRWAWWRGCLVRGVENLWINLNRFVRFGLIPQSLMQSLEGIPYPLHVPINLNFKMVLINAWDPRFYHLFLNHHKTNVLKRTRPVALVSTVSWPRFTLKVLMPNSDMFMLFLTADIYF